MRDREPSGFSPIMLLAAVVVCGAVVFVVVWFARTPKTVSQSSHSDRGNASSSTATVTMKTQPERQLIKSLDEKMVEAASLNDALSTASEAMADGSTLSKGTIALAYWGLTRLKWNEMKKLKETRYSLAQKDISEARGKVVCMNGHVGQIEVERVENEKVTRGGMADSDGDVLRFIAIGSSGDIVKGSFAKFCGIVTQSQSYENAGGGTTHAIVAVGMFELPANIK